MISFSIVKLRKKLFCTNKFVFFFNCSNWEKFEEKIGENKIGCLVVWCHAQDTRIDKSQMDSKKLKWADDIVILLECEWTKPSVFLKILVEFHSDVI